MFNNFMTKVDKKFHFLPPSLHWQNAAERAIQNYNNHFISGISRANKYFTMNFLCSLITQSWITFNMLQKSIINTKLSEYTQVHGAYDFNAAPVAPPGIRVLAH